MAKKITQAICQLNINSFRQLQIYSVFLLLLCTPLCFIWQLCCAHTHTHFSYCVFHKFLFALCNRRLTTKSHKCFRLSTKADMKASVIPMKRCICLSVPCGWACVCVCMCVCLSLVYVSWTIKNLFQVHWNCVWPLQSAQSWLKTAYFMAVAKNYCILLGCAIKQSLSLCHSFLFSLSLCW